MSLDLSTIKFSVETTELDTAVKKIETLGKSVEGLATSLGKLDKSTAEANRKQAQANLNNAKTEAINIKNAKTLRDSAAASDELTEATRKRQSVEERQEAITRNMADGYSRGQASILATAEAAGEATDRIGELLKTQRAMQGVSPFDRSLGAATVFANELRVLTVANDLYNQDLGFTKNQLMELGREHVRMTEQFKIQGKSLDGLNAEFNNVVQSAQQVTQAENTMAAAMKNADKATVDAGRANAYIESELQKVRFALQANNEELNRSTSNSLVRFENALKKSGLTLDQQRVKIDEYRKSQIELQKTQKANQTDYITRAVGPQITDIIVGLSTGQSPLTVMMQQGGQLRDQFGMMGIAAKDMGDVMRNAMKGMAQSVFDTGKAIGTMLVGGIFDAGKAVVNLGMNITGLNSVLDYSKRLLAAQGEEGFKYIGMLNRAGAVVTGVFAVGIATGVLSVLALGIAFVQVTKAQDDLTKSLVSSGAQLGLSNVDAIALAESFRGVGATSVEILAAFSQISESGKISRESLVAVAEAALLLENSGGKAASKTIEMFAKLADKPMETLSEYAQKTGLVDQAEMQRIETLVKLGQEITATEEATKILAKATEEEAAIMVASLSDVSRLWLTVKAGTSEAWRAVQEFASSAEVMSVVKVVLQTVAVLATEVWYGIKGIGESLGGLGAIAAAVMTDIKNLDTNFTASKGMLGVIEEQDKARADSYKDSIARIMQEGKYSREELNKTAALAATGRKATADAEKDRVAHELAMKPWKEQEQKSLADNLSKQEFIKQAIDKTNKALTEGKTLRAEEIAQITKLAGADWDKSNKPKKTKLTDEQKELNKAREEYIDIQNKAIGVNKEFNNQLDRQNLLFTKGEISEEAYVKGIQDLIKTQPFYTKGLADEEKAQNAAKKAADEHMKLVEEFTKIKAKFIETTLSNQSEIDNETTSLKLRNELLGKTEEEQKSINLQYKAQGDITKINLKYDKQRLDLQQEYLKLQADGFDVDYDTWNAQINESVKQQGEEAKLVWAGVAMSAAEDYQKEFDAIKSSITDVVMTSLFEGGKAGSKKIREVITAALMKPIRVVVDAVVNTLMGNVGNAVTGQAASGLMGSIGTSAAGQMIGMGAGGLLASPLAYGAAIGTTSIGAGSQAAMLAQQTGVFGAQGLAATTGAAGGGASALMAAAPYLALGAAILMLVDSLDDSGTPHTGGTGAYSAIGGARTDVSKELDWSIVEFSEATQQASLGITKSIVEILDATASSFGKEAGYYAATAFADDSSKDGAWGALMIKLGDQMLVDWEKGADNWPGREFGSGESGVKEYTAALASDLRDTLEQMGLPDWATNLLKNLGDAPTLDSLSKVVQEITRIQNVSEFMSESLGIAAENITGFVGAIGNADAAFSALSSFYDSFFDETEKTANLTRNTTKAFSDLGVEMPEVNSELNKWYKQQVISAMALDQSVPVNAKATAGLLNLQGNVLGLTASLAEVEDAITGVGSAATVFARLSWQDKVNAITKDPVALAEARVIAKQRDLASTDDPFTKSLIELSYQYEDEVAARQKQTDLMSLQDEAMKNYIDSQKNLLNAQKQYASVLRSTIESLKDFLSTLNNAASPLESTAKARTKFGELTQRAATGDTSVYSELAPAARTFLDLSKNYSRTIQDYRRDEASVRRTMNSVIQVNTSELAKLPSEISAASDPTKEAWTNLRDAAEKQSAAGLLVVAMSVDQVASQKRLNGTTASLVDRYLELIETLPNGEALKTAFDNTMDGYIKEVLPPRDDAFTFESTFKDVISTEIPTGFFGDKLNISEVAAEELRNKIPSMGDSFNLVQAVLEELKLKIPSMGDSFNLVQAVLEELKLKIPSMGDSFNLVQAALEELKLKMPSMGDSGNLVQAALEELKLKMPSMGDSGNLVQAVLEELKLKIPSMGDSGNLVQAALEELKLKMPSMGDSFNLVQAVLEELKLKMPSMGDSFNLVQAVLEELKLKIPSMGDSFNLKSLVDSTMVSIMRSVLGNSNPLVVVPSVNPITNLTPPSQPSPAYTSVPTGAVSAATGMTQFWTDSLGNIQSSTSGFKPEWFKSFDVGTNSVPYDMLANIHEGERIIPAADNTEIMQRLSSPQESNIELLSQLIQLNNRLQSLENSMIAGQVAIADNTRKTKNVLEKFDIDGLPKERK